MKKSCYVDKRRVDAGMCVAYEWAAPDSDFSAGRTEHCNLGHKIKNSAPMEPCPKPRSEKELLKIYRERERI